MGKKPIKTREHLKEGKKQKKIINMVRRAIVKDSLISIYVSDESIAPGLELFFRGLGYFSGAHLVSGLGGVYEF